MAITTNDQQQRVGKPKPPGSTAKHGTRTFYFYGCRCTKCRKAESTYQRNRQQAINSGEWVGRTTKEEPSPS